MKKLLFLAILFTSSFSFAQQTLVPFQQGKKWGYLSTDGSVAIEPQYKLAEPFCPEGIALVYDFKKRGYIFINTENNELQLPYEDFDVRKHFGIGTKGFLDGFAKIIYKEKLALVNTKGEEVYPPKYEKISRFHNGIAIGKMGTTWYLMDKTGTQTAIQTKAEAVDHLKNGYAPFKTSSGKWGFVDASGAVAIKAQFKTVGYFYNGLAWARTMDGKIGFIDPSGAWVVEPKYDAVSDFDNESKIARVKSGDKWMFLRLSGETFEIPDATKVGKFNNGRAWAIVEGLHGYVDAKGTWVVKPTYSKANNFSNGIAYVKKGDFWGMINTKGELILPTEYKKLGDLREGLIMIREYDLVGAVNTSGKVVIEPKFQAIKDFFDGYAMAKFANKWGIIDQQGNWVIKPEYSKLKRATTIK